MMENDLTIEILKKNTNNYIIPDKFTEIINKIKLLSENLFKELGTGFSEYIYHRALEIELRNNNIKYESKRIIPINYKGINVGYGEADIIIYQENIPIIIELKAVTNPPREIEIAQLQTYMRYIENTCLGLVINFPQPGTKIAKDTIDFRIIEKKNI